MIRFWEITLQSIAAKDGTYCIMFKEFRRNETDFNELSVHYLKRQHVALIIQNYVDQQDVIKIFRLLFISFTLGIFNIQSVDIKIGKYQQNLSFTFWAMKN